MEDGQSTSSSCCEKVRIFSGWQSDILRFSIVENSMFPLLAVILAGHGLGTFIKNGRSAYSLCFPASAAALFLTEILFTIFSSEGVQYSDFETLVFTGGIHTPVAMLGVYLARRKAKRNTYET
jgi:hypothetical protein